MKRMGLSFSAWMLIAAVAFSQNVNADGVQWLTDPPTALQQSRATGQLVLMKFTAEWCGYCKKMERTTFSDPVTAAAVHRDFVPLLIDVDKHEELARQLKIQGLPALLIVTPDMTILKQIKGYQTSERLLPQLNQILAQHQQSGNVPTLPLDDQPSPAMVADTNPFMQSAPSLPEEPPQPSMASPRSMPVSATTASQARATQPSFGGLCLTSVVEERRLVEGTADFKSRYRGQTLYFQNDDRRDQFYDAPDKYWPALDGNCAMTLLETGEQTHGQLKHAAVFRGQIWLFSSRDKMKTFIESPAAYVKQVQEREQMAGQPNRSF